MHLSPEIEKQLAVTPAGKLAELEFLKKEGFTVQQEYARTSVLIT